MVTAAYPWDDEGYLGSICVQRPGEIAPAISAHVIRSGPHLLYRKSVVTRGGGSWFEAARFSSTDRSRSMVVMASDTPERLDGLRAALAGDRWRCVVPEGSLDMPADRPWDGRFPEPVEIH